MIFIMIGLTVVIAVLLTVFNGGLDSIDLMLLAAMIFIPVFLFYFKGKKKYYSNKKS